MSPKGIDAVNEHIGATIQAKRFNSPMTKLCPHIWLEKSFFALRHSVRERSFAAKGTLQKRELPARTQRNGDIPEKHIVKAINLPVQPVTAHQKVAQRYR